MTMQHGRKPRKHWHKRSAARKQAQAMAHWPKTTADVPHDGEPQPLPQGHGGYKQGKKIRRIY